MSQECYDALKAIQTQFGYSDFFHENKRISRERLQIDKADRGPRRKYKPAEYKKLYHQQHGLCGICEGEMAQPKFWPGNLAVDHKNPNLAAGEWGAWANLQLVHDIPCNREKSSKSIQQQSKEGGKLFTELL